MMMPSLSLKNPYGVEPTQFLKRICVYICYNVVLHLILYWLEWKIIVYYPHQIVCVFQFDLWNTEGKNNYSVRYIGRIRLIERENKLFITKSQSQFKVQEGSFLMGFWEWNKWNGILKRCKNHTLLNLNLSFSFWKHG